MIQKIRIGDKTIEITVMKPRFFNALINMLIKNFEARETIAKAVEEDDDGKLDICVVFPIIGKSIIAKFNSKEDETLFLTALKKSKEIKKTIAEFEDVIEII